MSGEYTREKRVFVVASTFTSASIEFGIHEYSRVLVGPYIEGHIPHSKDLQEF
jgi:hypothetical protein